jgi:hypothetical protein
MTDSTIQPATVYRRQILLPIFIAVTAFLAYASIYAYRRPFTVATFEGIKFWGISYQSLLIISQVTGYMLSKFAGIRFIAELKRKGRWKTTIILVAIAWLSLFFFAITPPPYGMILFAVNGFMLGFMWGIIFSYVEGRRATDFIGSVMAISFIFAGGFTRTVAKWLMVEWSITEQWMPFMTGLVFALPLVVFIYMLEKIPAPDQQDIEERTVRLPMDKTQRQQFLKLFGAGIIVVTVTYIFLTLMRDIRDNYMANLWNELGYADNYAVFTKTETTTSLVILLLMGMLALIRKNIVAFRIIHWVIAAGFLIAFTASLLFVNKQLDGALWMQLTGLGLYMGYIPFNSIFFERLIASFKVKGNVGFLIYIADSFGYLFSVIVILSKEFLQLYFSWSQFYSWEVLIVSTLGIGGTILSFLYFNKKYKLQNS